MIISSRPEVEDPRIICVTAVELLDDALDALETGVMDINLGHAWQAGAELAKCRILIQAAQKFLMETV